MIAMSGEPLDGPWANIARQSEKFDNARRHSLENLAEQSKILKAEEEIAKQGRSPLVPDFFYQPIKHPERIIENCLFKSAYGGVAGFGFGFLFGVFFASTAFDAQMSDMAGTTTQKAIEGLKQTGRQGLSTAKNFGQFSIVFSGVECLIEKHRAKSDRYNSVSAGCILCHTTFFIFTVQPFITYS